METAQIRPPQQAFGPALEKARADFGRGAPAEIQAHAGAPYQWLDPENGRFLLPFLGDLHAVSWPDGSVQTPAGDAVDAVTQLLVLHYLVTADGEAPADRWIAFRELPGGLGYMPAFHARAAQRLISAFGSNRSAFEAAALSIGGRRLVFGDASFAFRVFPNLWLAVVLHLSDDEFPAEVNVLFDAAACHYLPTEDLAVLGGSLAGRLIKAARSR